MLVDTHCHAHDTDGPPNFSFKEDSDAVVRSALAKDVQMVMVGTHRKTSAEAVACAERYDGVWAAVGLHPTDVLEESRETFDVEFYRALSRHPKTVAVGEMGFDYFHVDEHTPVEEQRRHQAEIFEAGARLAIEEGLPVVIHCRDAHDDQIGLIEKIWGAYTEGDAPRGVIHCFTGSWHDAKRYFKLGFYVSFTGVITFPPRKSDIAAGKELLTDVVKKAPLGMIMVETDAPYLAPMPHRGERNLPEYVEEVARKVAELKGISFEEVCDATTANARRLFSKMA